MSRLARCCLKIMRSMPGMPGAISESTALNVGQTNTSVLSADQKNAVSGAVLPLSSPLACCTTGVAKGGIGLVLPVVLSSTTETGDSGSTVILLTQKKEVGLTRVRAEKKKMDARKKSLKRL